MELIVATKNKKKLEEIREILKDTEFSLKSLLDYPRKIRIVENGKSFKENAIKKAVKVAKVTKTLSLGEDSGLCVNFLKGAPGVYSSRFSGKNKSDAQNNLKLLKLLEGIPLSGRRAHYACAVALADKNGLLGVVEGWCYGAISLKLKGRRGFGYDPLFIVAGYNKTFGQLSEGIKHKISHRYNALNKARKIIQKYIENG